MERASIVVSIMTLIIMILDIVFCHKSPLFSYISFNSEVLQ